MNPLLHLFNWSAAAILVLLYDCRTTHGGDERTTEMKVVKQQRRLKLYR
jgi:hypothetical protein